MITVEEVIKSVSKSEYYWGDTVDTKTAVDYTMNDYEDSLSITLHTLKSLPTGDPTTLKTIEEIFLVLDRQYDKVVEGVTNHINLIKLEKIL